MLLGAFWGSLKIVDLQIASAKERSRNIIEAMDKYYDANKQYPEKLEQLEPDYISKVLIREWGSSKQVLNMKRRMIIKTTG
jgi:hypothetical protein